MGRYRDMSDPRTRTRAWPSVRPMTKCQRCRPADSVELQRVRGRRSGSYQPPLSQTPSEARGEL
jgi:hypothetical protein